MRGFFFLLKGLRGNVHRKFKRGFEFVSSCIQATIYVIELHGNKLCFSAGFNKSGVTHFRNLKAIVHVNKDRENDHTCIKKNKFM